MPFGDSLASDLLFFVWGNLMITGAKQIPITIEKLKKREGQLLACSALPVTRARNIC